MIADKGRSPIVFYKFSGSGNDFIIIDNRNRVVDEINLTHFISKLCRRRMSIGADGLILVENPDDPEGIDFKWRYFNADGSVAGMCGNGARCVAHFAFLKGIAGLSMTFKNEAGIVTAEIKGNRVKLHMPNPTHIQIDDVIPLITGPLTVSSVDTGVPHVVVFVDPGNDIDVVVKGREIRFHQKYAPAGTNVNFIHLSKDHTVVIRTYERGVEDETLACGTGAIASALITAIKYGIESPITLKTRSGENLEIYFEQKKGQFINIYLEGDARLVYRGEMGDDAWMY